MDEDIKDSKTEEKGYDNEDQVLREGDSCPLCGCRLMVKHTAKSSFLACSNYPECSFTYSLTEKNYNVIYRILDEKCPDCGSNLCIRGGRYGVFIGCTSYPECSFIFNFNKKTEVHCPMCKDGILEQRRSKSNSTFYGCSNYPKCKYTLTGEPLAKTCPVCGFPVVFRKKCKGGFKIACGSSMCPSRHRRKSLFPEGF